MAGFGKLKDSLPATPRAWLWPAATAFFGIGVLISLVHLGGVGGRERSKALEESQRFTISMATGEISLKRKEPVAEEPASEDGNDAAETEPAAETTEEPAATEPTPPPGEASTEQHSTEAPPPTATEHSEPASAPAGEAAATPAPATTDSHATPEAAATPPASTPAEATPAAATPDAHTASPAPTAETAAPAASAPDAAHPEPKAAPAAAAPAATTPAPAETSKAAPTSAPALRTEPISSLLTAPTRTKDSLVIAPAPEVSETVDGMVLPKMGDKGVAPSKLYARPFRRTSEQVLLSFVVLDGGLDTQSIGLLLALPQEVSIAYSPYAKGGNYGEHLRAAGHELWAMLPTMNEGYPADDPGPMGLVNRMPPEEILRRTHLVMAAVPGSVGLVLPADETISQHKDSLKPVLADVSKRGLLLMQANPARSLDQLSADPALKKLLTKATLVLDEQADEAQIRSKLSSLMETALESREAIVVLSARPQTLQILNEWLRETILEKPITLAPLSAMYQPVAAAEEVKPADDGHGKKAEKKKPKPAEKKKKPLPQDQYLKPKDEKKGGGGH